MFVKLALGAILAASPMQEEIEDLETQEQEVVILDEISEDLLYEEDAEELALEDMIDTESSGEIVFDDEEE